VAQIVAPFLAGLLIEHRQLELWALAAAAASVVGLLFHRAETRAAADSPTGI
jgi:hypothetical protein